MAGINSRLFRGRNYYPEEESFDDDSVMEAVFDQIEEEEKYTQMIGEKEDEEKERKRKKHKY
jgi:hypothetical protein